MRKVLTIGISALLAGIGSQAANSMLKTEKEDVSHQYTHLIGTYQSQAFEPVSQAALFWGQPALQNSYQTAAVHFIVNDGKQVFGSFEEGGGLEFPDPTEAQCKGEGYTLNSCENGTPGDICPYNSSYFKECCDKAYSYTAENCSLLNTTSSCGGKYKCDCTPESYPVTAGSCASPQIPSNKPGSSCTVNGQVRYSECVCPESYAETCNGINVRGKGTGCTKNGSTTYVSCECEPKYKLTCSGEGNSPANPSDYCQLNGIRYYENCDVCPFNCSVAEKQAGVTYEYEECSKKYCATGCAEGYVNWCKKPETDCVKLGYTKTASQCPHGYLACPHNSIAVFCDD